MNKENIFLLHESIEGEEADGSDIARKSLSVN
jgi:hypothetical protein